MSDPKRATLITVGAPKSAKNNVMKTVRLSINLVESNESKYPELNYKELVIEQEWKPSPVENGKKPGLDPFSDNDDDVERVARKFEQKYGGKSTYGKKTRREDYADIGAGYDRNDSFIDDTDGYDEYIPPGCDTRYGGFYINSGSLEFKSVPPPPPPPPPDDARRNKRRISSSSSEEESSGSSSGSDSQPAKDPKPTVNGVHSQDAEHRKKKMKNLSKKAKRVKRNDSSAAASGKQTSDDTGPNEPDSGDTASSQSGGSARPHTEDSSRDADPKPELPKIVQDVLTELIAHLARAQLPVSLAAAEERGAAFLIRLETAILSCEARAQKAAWSACARALRTSRAELGQRARRLQGSQPVSAPAAPAAAAAPGSPREDFTALSAERREEIIVDALRKLEALIEERKPAMIATYNAECTRVQEERKKLQSLPDGPHPERRLPKRRFPWCGRARALLARVAAAAAPAAAAALRARALPLFPKGFVRMPTLLRQANLKTELPRQQSTSSQPHPAPSMPTPVAEQIHFPSSLTVTTTTKPPDHEEPKKPKNPETTFGKILSSYNMNHKDEEDKGYVPPNNIGSITITAVQNKPEKARITPVTIFEKHKEPLIRVKSPAALMKEATDLAKKDKCQKKVEKKPLDTPLHVDTNVPDKPKESPSPKDPKERLNEDKLPRPGLIPKHHSPNFVKPEKRPPESKKKKDVLIVSDLDPLEINTELVTIDESSSDVELVEEKNSDSDKVISDTVPSDKSDASAKDVRKHKDVDDSEVDIDAVMKNLREMQDSQEPSFTSNSFSGVIANAKSSASYRERRERDKFADLSSLSKMDGCSAVTG